MALIKEDAVDDAFDCLVDGRVCENDVCRLAAELQRVFLVRAGERLLDDSSDIGRAGKGDLVHVRMFDNRSTSGTRAGHDINDTGWQPGVSNNLGELQRG